MAIVVGTKTVGFSNPSLTNQAQPPTHTPDLRDTLNYLLQKHQDLETLVESKVSKDGIKSAIKYSSELISIQAQDIVLVGDVTIASIIKEQNGTTSGELPASITRIIGDRVQTGTIASNNYGASEGTAFDLDNGIIIIGGSTSPSLYYDGAGNLTISGALSAATGSFAGNISTSGYVYATGSVTAGGWTGGIIGDVTSGYGVVGQSSAGYGVVGYSTASINANWFGSSQSGYYGLEIGGSGQGIKVSVGSSDIGLNLGTSYITKTRQNGQLIKVYNTSTHALVATYEYSFE